MLRTPVEPFQINHEKLLHLIVIVRDLSYFNHIHQEYKGESVFEIENAFPADGDYPGHCRFQAGERRLHDQDGVGPRGREEGGGYIGSYRGRYKISYRIEAVSKVTTK